MATNREDTWPRAAGGGCLGCLGALGAALLLGFLALGVLRLTDHMPAVGSPSRAAYGESLARALDRHLVFCDTRGSASFTCHVATDDTDSGSDGFLIERRGRRCWQARAIARDEGAPARRVDGCVAVGDQLAGALFGSTGVD